MAEQAKDKLVDDLHRALADLVALKIRLPTLKSIVKEFDAMKDDENLRARNDVVLQIVRDSFDMLVIDLASLREGLTGRGGVFEALAADSGRLRRFTEADVQMRSTWVGQCPENADAYEKQDREEMARRWNKVLDRLFPGCETVTADSVAQLVKRFRKDTEATDLDRNRVRAHNRTTARSISRDRR